MVLKDQGQNQILPENHPELQAEDSTPELHHEPEFSREYEGQRAHIEPGEEGEEEEMGKAAKVSLSRGIWIGAATFVPTFLAVFFGIPYLLGSLVPNHSSLPPWWCRSDCRTRCRRTMPHCPMDRSGYRPVHQPATSSSITGISARPTANRQALDGIRPALTGPFHRSGMVCLSGRC